MLGIEFQATSFKALQRKPQVASSKVASCMVSFKILYTYAPMTSSSSYPSLLLGHLKGAGVASFSPPVELVVCPVLMAVAEGGAAAIEDPEPLTA